MTDDDFRARRMAVAEATPPDLRELKRCRFATSSVRFAPCELPMGHQGSCFNGDRKRALEKNVREAFGLKE